MYYYLLFRLLFSIEISQRIFCALIFSYRRIFGKRRGLLLVWIHLSVVRQDKYLERRGHQAKEGRLWPYCRLMKRRELGKQEGILLVHKGDGKRETW